MINVDELRQILDLARDHELSELEIEAEGFKIRIRKGGQVIVQPATSIASVLPPPQAVPHAASAAGQAAGSAPDIDVDMELAIVKSPIVGTFYRAPDPNAPPFVRPGDSVKKGQTLCIIEAMKMMNSIDSEYEGTVVKVFAENGQPVQYGERLFAMRLVIQDV
jgi:acetyl-CoA carboxylase biotin carboxyl carrier protein